MHEFYEIVHTRNVLYGGCWPMINGMMCVPRNSHMVKLHFATGYSLEFDIYNHHYLNLQDQSKRYWHLLQETEFYNPKLLTSIAMSERQQINHGNSSIALFKMLYDMTLYKIHNYPHVHSETYDVIKEYFLREHTRYTARHELWVEYVLQEGWERTWGCFVKH